MSETKVYNPIAPDKKKETVGGKVVIVDVSSAVTDQAVDRAEEKLTAASAEVSGISGFFKKVWKHNLFREYYRQREIARTKQGILKEQNIYYGSGDDKSDHQQTMEAVVNRFESDLNETVHREAGETRELLGTSERDKYVRTEIEKVVRAFASGKIDEDNFIEERNRILSSLNGLGKKEANSGLMYADNLLEVAKNIRGLVEHGSKLEDLDLDLQVIVGKAKMGVRTEAQYNAIDRIAERISRTRVGSLINETTVASALSVAYCLGSRLSEKALRSNAAKIGSFGATAAVAGAIAGIKESRRFAEERKKHCRDVAKGRTFNPDNAPRRKNMEEYRYQTRDAANLIQELTERTDLIAEYNDENVYQLNRILAETEARIRVSDRHKIDLLAYSSEKKVEEERLKLDLARAKAKVALKEALVKNLGFTDTEVDEYINRITETKVRELIDGDQGVEQKNRLFREMRRKRVAGAVVKGVLSGILIGGVVQEAGAFLKDNQEGLVESLVKGHDNLARNFTALEFLKLKLTGKLPTMDHFFDHTVTVGKNTFNLTKGVELVSTGPDSYQLVRNGEILSDGLKTNPDGGLTAESVQMLREKGFIADQMRKMVPMNTVREVVYKVPKYIDQVKKVVTPSTYKETEVGAIDLVRSKLGLFSQIHRNIWFDNDTPGVFDKNELKLLWGGDHGVGMTKAGDFVMNIKQMQPDGSYHDGFSVDAQQLIAQGKVRLLLSLSEDTQKQVVELPFDQNGNAIINKDSDIAKMFFAVDGGHAKFLGKFAEVGQFTGQNADGSDNFNLLATAVGDGVDKVKIITEIPGAVTETVERVATDPEIIRQQFTETWYDYAYDTEISAPGSYDWEPPLVIPILGRRPLEPRRPIEDDREPLVIPAPPDDVPPEEVPESPKDDPEDIPEYYFTSGASSSLSENIARHLEENLSPVLKENPGAKLNQQKEIGRYLDSQKEEYRQKIEEMAAQAGEMKAGNRLSICIPVAGHQEGKNIYQSLENYSYQNADHNSFEIVLFVNAPLADKEGRPIDFDETPLEIERFKKDHPEIDVRVITARLKPEEANIGFIRKALTDAVLVRQHDRKEGAPELILVSNDADNKGVSPDYVQNFINKFDANPDVDGLLGQLDWDPESYVRHPAIHVGTRLFQYLGIIGRHRSGAMVSSGANFAYRAGIYAAVGGYVETSGGEDVAVGMSIVNARGGDRSRIKFAGGDASRLYTSSRRAVDAFKSGLAPVEQWNKGFSAFDDDIRKKPEVETEKINYDDVETLNGLKSDMEMVINRTLDEYEKGDKLGKGSLFYRRAIGWLGVKYELDDKGEVKITDMSDLVAGLKEYKEYGVKLRDEKSGKAETEATEADKETDLAEFYETDDKEAALTDGTIGIKTLAEDQKFTIKVGDYLVAETETVPKNGSYSSIRLAKKEGSDELFIVKETPVAEIEEGKSLRGGLPEGFKTVEELLKGNVDEEKVLLPEAKVEENGQVIRIYKSGEIDLESYLLNHQLTPKQATAVIIKAADAIRGINKAGVVYADLAPSNILIDGNKVKLIDTDGAYCGRNGHTICHREAIFGNRFIMAPEMFESGNFFDQTADVYALGANLYRLAAGDWPYMFDEETAGMTHEERLAYYGAKHKEGKISFPEEMDEKLKAIISKAMDPRPSKRYRSADEMAAVLLDYYKSL